MKSPSAAARVRMMKFERQTSGDRQGAIAPRREQPLRYGRGSFLRLSVLAALLLIRCDRSEPPRGDEASVVDLIGPKESGGQRILGALLPHEDRVWFFKLAGPSDKVGAQKEKFEAFLRSIQFTPWSRVTPSGEKIAVAPQAASTNT